MRQLELLAAPHDPHPRTGRLAELRPRGLPIAAAAEYLGVSRWTVQRLRARGELDGYHVGAGAFITLDSLDRYAEEHRDRRGG